MDHAELRNVSWKVAHDGFPQEAEEQSDREGLTKDDGEEEEERSVGGASEDRRGEEACEDVEVHGEGESLIGLCDSVREDHRRYEEDKDGDQVADVLVQGDRRFRN